MKLVNSPVELKDALQSVKKTSNTISMVLDVEAVQLDRGGDALSVAIVIGFGRLGLEDFTAVACWRLAAEEFKAEAKAQAEDGDDFHLVNTLPYLEGVPTVKTARQLRDEFWVIFSEMKKISSELSLELEVLSDVNLPVESRFLEACQDDGQGSRMWDLPFPLLDMVMILRQAGLPTKFGGPNRSELAGSDLVLAEIAKLNLPEKTAQHNSLFDCIASIMAVQSVTGYKCNF